MIGLPTETDEDLVAIRDLTLQLRDIMLRHARARGRIGRIVASVNPLVPKPGTTYQWLPMERSDVIEQKMKRLRTLVSDIDNVYFNIKSERHSYYQALLSLGDRRVAPAIEAAERNGGQWRRAVADSGVDGDFYIFRDRSADAVLPWDIIDGGMKEQFFRGELEKSLRAEWTLPPKRAKENARLLPVLPMSGLSQPCARRRSQLATATCASNSRTPAGSARARRSCACDVAARGRSSAKLRRSPLTDVAARRKRDVAARRRCAAPRRANPISLRPCSSPSVKCSSASASFPGGFPLSFGMILTTMIVSSRVWPCAPLAGAALGSRSRRDARRDARVFPRVSTSSALRRMTTAVARSSTGRAR